MKLNKNEIGLIFHISNNIDIAGITNEEIDKLIDFQDSLKVINERIEKKIDKIYQSEKVERTDEAVQKLSPEAQDKLYARLNAVTLPEIEPLRIFERDVVTEISKQYGLGAVRLAREVFCKVTKEK